MCLIKVNQHCPPLSLLPFWQQVPPPSLKVVEESTVVKGSTRAGKVRMESRLFDVGKLQKQRFPPVSLHLQFILTWRTLKAVFVMAQHYPFPLSQIMSGESIKPKAFRDCVWGSGGGGGSANEGQGDCVLQSHWKMHTCSKTWPPPVGQSFHHQNFQVFIISSKLGSHYTFSVS